MRSVESSLRRKATEPFGFRLDVRGHRNSERPCVSQRTPARRTGNAAFDWAAGARYSNVDWVPVTYVVEGRIHHYDNQGHEGTILPGDVQWMTAGRGLIHSEIPAESVTEGRLSTYCGRTRPPPWTPQLGGNLPLHGDHWTAELLDVHRRFAMSALTSTPAVPSALFAVVPQWRVRMGQVDALRKVVDRARHTWPLSGSLDEAAHGDK